MTPYVVPRDSVVRVNKWHRWREIFVINADNTPVFLTGANGANAVLTPTNSTSYVMDTTGLTNYKG